MGGIEQRKKKKVKSVFPAGNKRHGETGAFAVSQAKQHSTCDLLYELCYIMFVVVLVASAMHVTRSCIVLC
jgi:hypothetical protein